MISFSTTQNDGSPKFVLGQIVGTPEALASMYTHAEIFDALDPDQLIEFSNRVDHWENQPEFVEDEEDDVADPLDEPWDHIVAQQELEDFEQADEYFGCSDDGDF